MLTSLDGLLGNITTCTGVNIQYNTILNTWGNSFANLQMIQGSLQISYQRATTFTSMRNAFPRLQNVTGQLYLQYNDYVSDMTGAFPQLTWVNNQLYIYYMSVITPRHNTRRRFCVT